MKCHFCGIQSEETPLYETIGKQQLSGSIEALQTRLLLLKQQYDERLAHYGFGSKGMEILPDVFREIQITTIASDMPGFKNGFAGMENLLRFAKARNLAGSTTVGQVFDLLRQEPDYDHDPNIATIKQLIELAEKSLEDKYGEAWTTQKINLNALSPKLSSTIGRIYSGLAATGARDVHIPELVLEVSICPVCTGVRDKLKNDILEIVSKW